MYLNSFSLRIVGGQERDGGYVDISHGQKYSLQMRNDQEGRCDARVEIDGQHVGTWRIGRRSTINIDRPAHDTGQFTFYRPGSDEADRAQLNGTSPDLGLVKVTFTPEVQARPVYRTFQAWNALVDSVTMGIDSFSVTRGAGGTGLSGQSQQYFTSATEIVYDYSRQIVIQLRLVCVDTDTPRPLTAYSTPYPPRID